LESLILTDFLLYTTKTIALKLFKKYKYPWQVLPEIKNFIFYLINKLDKNSYKQIEENVYVNKSAKLADSAKIFGPAIICENAEIRHCAFIRGNAIIGAETVIGNSTEIKNSILFDKVQVPHYNYIGDSILGFKAHLGAGAVTSNVKSDKSSIFVKNQNIKIETNLKKFGAIVGDFAEIGCNAVLNPGTIIGRNTSIYPLSLVRGVVPPNSIFKTPSCIIEKI